MTRVQLAVKLGSSANCCSVHTNEKYNTCAGLGCKRSLVQIQSRRPSYLSDILRYYLSKLLCPNIGISAHKCSKVKTNEWGAGGKIGVLSAILNSHVLISFLRPLKTFSHLFSKNQTTSFSAIEVSLG